MASISTTSAKSSATIATPANELKQYLILVPDHPQPNTLALRRATQPSHNRNATPLIDAGRLPYFGVTLAQHPVAPDNGAVVSSELEINGSLIVLHAESEKEVRDLLERDPYATAGVWDLARVKVIPFRAG